MYEKILEKTVNIIKWAIPITALVLVLLYARHSYYKKVYFAVKGKYNNAFWYIDEQLKVYTKTHAEAITNWNDLDTIISISALDIYNSLLQKKYKKHELYGVYRPVIYKHENDFFEVNYILNGDKKRLYENIFLGLPFNQKDYLKFTEDLKNTIKSSIQKKLKTIYRSGFNLALNRLDNKLFINLSDSMDISHKVAEMKKAFDAAERIFIDSSKITKNVFSNKNALSQNLIALDLLHDKFSRFHLHHGELKNGDPDYDEYHHLNTFYLSPKNHFFSLYKATINNEIKALCDTYTKRIVLHSMRDKNPSLTKPFSDFINHFDREQGKHQAEKANLNQIDCFARHNQLMELTSLLEKVCGTEIAHQSVKEIFCDYCEENIIHFLRVYAQEDAKSFVKTMLVAIRTDSDDESKNLQVPKKQQIPHRVTEEHAELVTSSIMLKLYLHIDGISMDDVSSLKAHNLLPRASIAPLIQLCLVRKEIVNNFKIYIGSHLSNIMNDYYFRTLKRELFFKIRSSLREGKF